MSDESMLRVAQIPAGEFVMGTDDTEDDERPAHKTYLDEFSIGTYPVTNAEYAQFVRETQHPSPGIRGLPLIVSGALEADFRSLAAKYLWNNGTPPEERDHHPVTLVGYDDAVAYCGWIASKIGKPVRLPTEAEWEKAARGGLDGKRYPWGDTLDPACAHFLQQAGLKSERGTAEVGSYPSNGFDLFDMSGNVWEWVSDWYSPNYYARAQYLNPQGSEGGIMRIVRGGAWVNAEGRYLRCAYRHKVPPDSYAYSIGFRVAYSPK
jgi:sulfatase modifying factor 1